MLESIRIEKQILNLEKKVITNYKSHNLAKKASKILQSKGLGLGQLKLMVKFPKGEYTHVQA